MTLFIILQYDKWHYRQVFLWQLWPWRMTLTMECHTQDVWLYEIHMHAKYKVFISNTLKVINFDLYWWPLTRVMDLVHLLKISDLTYMCIWPLTLKDDLWPWHITIQNVHLYYIHMHAKYNRMKKASAALWDAYVLQIWSLYLFWSKGCGPIL